jgi:hypothetical protein
MTRPCHALIVETPVSLALFRPTTRTSHGPAHVPPHRPPGGAGCLPESGLRLSGTSGPGGDRHRASRPVPASQRLDPRQGHRRHGQARRGDTVRRVGRACLDEPHARHPGLLRRRRPRAGRLTTVAEPAGTRRRRPCHRLRGRSRRHAEHVQPGRRHRHDRSLPRDRLL